MAKNNILQKYFYLLKINPTDIICQGISMRFEVKNLIGHVASTFMVDKPIKFSQEYRGINGKLYFIYSKSFFS